MNHRWGKWTFEVVLREWRAGLCTYSPRCSAAARITGANHARLVHASRITVGEQYQFRSSRTNHMVGKYVRFTHAVWMKGGNHGRCTLDSYRMNAGWNKYLLRVGPCNRNERWGTCALDPYFRDHKQEKYVLGSCHLNRG